MPKYKPFIQLFKQVFVLDVRFEEIAKSLGRTGVACRKAASRARAKVRSKRPEMMDTTPLKEYEKVASRFFNAIKDQDFDSLLQLLTEEARLTADSDGKAAATKKVLKSPKSIIGLLFVAYRRTIKMGGEIEIRKIRFSGAPGYVVFVEKEPVSAYHFEMISGKIRKIFVHRNPEKLKGFSKMCE